jgi:hypothetical protein
MFFYLFHWFVVNNSFSLLSPFASNAMTFVLKQVKLSWWGICAVADGRPSLRTSISPTTKKLTLHNTYVHIITEATGGAVYIEMRYYTTTEAYQTTRPVGSDSESEGILGGVGVGKNIPTPTPTSI